ncbi:MAG: hypothetical protein OHK0046_31890 [Anaerolineae bacterium]
MLRYWLFGGHYPMFNIPGTIPSIDRGLCGAGNGAVLGVFDGRIGASAAVFSPYRPMCQSWLRRFRP